LKPYRDAGGEPLVGGRVLELGLLEDPADVVADGERLAASLTIEKLQL
jgi:hypothetical protein